LTRLLKSIGLETVACASAEALLQAHPWVPEACLILDVQLPGMTGWELVDYLRAIDIKIPVIIMTAYHDRQTQDHAMDADVVAYLRKPFHDQELIAALQRVLSQRRAEQG
jgi:FixJ family two-component response regulator